MRRLSARYRRLSQAHDRELNLQELSSLCHAVKVIADEVWQGMLRGRSASPAPLTTHALIIDGRELQEHRIRVLDGSRAARLLDKDPRAFRRGTKIDSPARASYSFEGILSGFCNCSAPSMLFMLRNSVTAA